MILEAVELLVTPCQPVARRLGYRSEMVALGARWRRQKRAWAPHVAKSRAFLRAAIDRVPAGGRALVLGSGRLIEIPAADLAARFAEVVLLDVVHPLETRLAALRWRNVSLRTLDVTGVLKALRFGERGGGAWSLPVPQPPDLGRFDIALSCNLLSQLPLFPLRALAERSPAIDAAALDRFGRDLEAAHIEALRQAGAVAALYTDVERIARDVRDGAEEREPMVYGPGLPPPDLAWDWEIAPAPEEERFRDLRHTVHAWFDLNRASEPPAPLR